MESSLKIPQVCKHDRYYKYVAKHICDFSVERFEKDECSEGAKNSARHSRGSRHAPNCLREKTGFDWFRGRNVVIVLSSGLGRDFTKKIHLKTFFLSQNFVKC